ncbi:MAG: hypothetical protein H7279_09435, partial [Microbacteriaceae bacterium]|nr:hypothetical protein [Microbacteriaceae bacterium]
MSLEVKSRSLAIPDLGPPDALPMVGGPLQTPYTISGDFPSEIIAGSVYGNPATPYPHQELGGYGRALVDTPVLSVVPENDRSRAVFLPEWGGRLWELFDTSVPMCRWTNAAVPEIEHSRVLAPADSAFASSSEGGISRVPVATGTSATTNAPTNVTDRTRPSEHSRARDFFFDITPKQRPWILAADRDGGGLATPSSSELRGRKLFVGGRGARGKYWQRWVTPRGGEYAEIRAGLAQTQF